MKRLQGIPKVCLNRKLWGQGFPLPFLTTQNNWLHEELGDVLQQFGSAPR